MTALDSFLALRRARNAKATALHSLMRLDGVVAVGVGYKTVEGIVTDDLSVVVSVVEKVPVEALGAGQLIPESVAYSGDISIPTDVVETGLIEALRTSKHRPAPGGVSIGHFGITAGTLGCLVRDRGEDPPDPPPDPPMCPIALSVTKAMNKAAELTGSTVRLIPVRIQAEDNDIFILSNNHVLANSNEAEVGDAILQPGPYDGGTLTDTIAELERFIPIDFSSGGVNYIDAAIARPLSPIDVVNDILELGPPTGVADVELGMALLKSGRTTELTSGVVIQTDVTVAVQYNPGQVATFQDQILAGDMSAGGDSGSLVVDENNAATGLLFAGSDTVTVLSPMHYVLDLLEVELLELT